MTSRPFTTIRFAKREGVAFVTLDRPSVLNAYDRAMRDDLHAVLGAVDEDPEVRVLVLRGRGRAFSVGGDLAEFGSAPSPIVAREVRWQRDVWGRLLDVRAVTVASVHGWVVGGGMEIAMLCDLCIAAETARFALPETGLGMIPGVAGTQTLPRRAGESRALATVLSGQPIDAKTAAAFGIVNAVVAAATLPAATLALARRAARVDPRVAAAIRRCVRAAHDGTLADGVALERRLGPTLQTAG